MHVEMVVAPRDVQVVRRRGVAMIFAKIFLESFHASVATTTEILAQRLTRVRSRSVLRRALRRGHAHSPRPLATRPGAPSAPFTDDALLAPLQALSSRSHHIEAAILEHSIEVEERRLHLERGFPSMFAF